MTNVDLVGFVTGDSLRNLIRGAICTVLPAEWYENCPMSILESMALARPVIGSNIGGIPELINPEEDGLIVDSGSTEQLAAAISRLGNDVAKSLRMGANARAKVERDFSPENHYKQISAVYEKLL
jgi:glycosyltransferase involved in cell wall biosynthesis